MSIWDPCQRVFVQIISLRMGLAEGLAEDGSRPPREALRSEVVAEKCRSLTSSGVEFVGP